jgi:hypothetical protein
MMGTVPDHIKLIDVAGSSSLLFKEFRDRLWCQLCSAAAANGRSGKGEPGEVGIRDGNLRETAEALNWRICCIGRMYGRRGQSLPGAPG